MKKFLNKAEGFTLVELIVVIAILGILAGVAVPAYTGYIKKANEAADTQVISALNTAVAAAAAGEGCEASDLTAACAINEGAGTVTITACSDANATLANIQNDFAMYMNAASYGSGIAVTFDYYTTVTFANGVFTGTAG